MSGFFFKAMVQAGFLLGLGTWVVAPRMGRGLGGVPGPDGAMADGATTAAENWQEVGVQLGGDSKGRGGVLDNGGVHVAIT